MAVPVATEFTSRLANAAALAASSRLLVGSVPRVVYAATGVLDEELVCSRTRQVWMCAGFAR
jgi:hypothetical protein